MGLLPEFIENFLRDRIIKKLKLYGSTLDARIQEKSDELEATSEAISQFAVYAEVEADLLEENRDIVLSLGKQNRIYHAIIEVLYRRRLRLLGPALLDVSHDTRRAMQLSIRNKYMELQATSPRPVGLDPMLFDLHMMEQAWFESLAQFLPRNPDEVFGTIRQMLRLAYKGKVRILHYRLPQ